MHREEPIPERSLTFLATKSPLELEARVFTVQLAEAMMRAAPADTWPLCPALRIPSRGKLVVGSLWVNDVDVVYSLHIARLELARVPHHPVDAVFNR